MAARAGKRKTITAYVVQKVHWEYNDEYDDRYGGTPVKVFLEWVSLPGEGEGAGTPVKAFRNYEKAAAFCRDQELKRRAKANPFDGGNPYRGIAEVSSFDADRFHDWLLDAGIEPPEKSRSKTFTLGKWSAWWKKVRKDLTDYQQAKVWEALDKVCFCDIIELEPPGE